MIQYAKNIRAKPFLLFLAMVGIIILITTLVTITKYSNLLTTVESNNKPINRKIHISNPLVYEAKNFSSIPNGAFAFLALGAQANQMNCPAAIESLVRYGGWNGDIYLISDQAHCFDTKEIIKNAGIKDPSKFHFVITKESFSTGGVDFQHSNVGFRKSRVRSFAVKTELFDLIPDPKIEVIAYVDCDILFSFQGCPKQFLEAGPTWQPNMIKFGRVKTEADGYVSDVHAGTFVIHRKHSANILKLWKDQILSGSDEGDNNAFIRLYHHHDLPYHPNQTAALQAKAKATGREFMAPNEWTLSSLLLDYKKDAGHSTNWFEKFLLLLPNTTHQNIACMNHISKARCSSYGREVVQEFVSRYHLKTYGDNRYSYCTHSLLQPLLYGWFPFGYLPFCPKMETLL